MPDISTSHPIYRAIPVVLRCSVRAKSPSDLLELGGALTLPLLPNVLEDDGTDPNNEGPKFILRREMYCRSAKYSGWEHSTVRSPCQVRWDSSHIGTGFTQAKGSAHFEDGREGATPQADEQASKGLAHGWTWPVRDTDFAHFTPPINRSPQDAQAIQTHNANRTRSTDSNASLSKDDLAKYHFVTTATLFGWVWPEASPEIQLQHLRSFYHLDLSWPVVGMRNSLDLFLAQLRVNAGIHANERNLVSDDDLQQAMLDSANFDLDGMFLRDAPPPPPVHGDEKSAALTSKLGTTPLAPGEELPSYSSSSAGPSNSKSSEQAIWADEKKI